MSKEYFQRRQNKLSEELSKHNLDGMLVTNMIHIRYLFKCYTSCKSGGYNLHLRR